MHVVPMELVVFTTLAIVIETGMGTIAQIGRYERVTCHHELDHNPSLVLTSIPPCRICQFGLAHIDNPKGDLDFSGHVSGPDVNVIKNSLIYPYGTSEQYPLFVDTEGSILDNTAHEYAECSNKGLCDRKEGVCQCFPGYEGSHCQRLSCPYNETTGLVCNGHGLCETAHTIAQNDYKNVYNLWDRHISQGCVCEAGFYGPMCESRMCKVGYDPIFYDEQGSRRHANWSYVISSTSATAVISGNYSIIFYDYTGQAWHTGAIDYNARCSEVVEALEALPNNVIEKGSMRCLQWLDYNSISSDDESILTSPNSYYGTKFTIDFPVNPGLLRQPKFDLHLDGSRPTLTTSELDVPASIVVYPDGFTGYTLYLISPHYTPYTLYLPLIPLISR